MADVNININGRNYEIACDAGQEGRIVDLAAYIDQKMQQIARSGGAYNDAHLFVLTALVLADELMEEREAAQAKPTRQQVVAASPANKEDEQAFLRALGDLAKRIEGLAARVQAA